MDYIIYEDKTHASFPTVSASPSSPVTLYHAANDLVYVHVGSGWQPAVQPGSNSVYSAVSTASASTQAAVIASVSKTTAAPSALHTAVVTKVVSVINNGH